MTTEQSRLSMNPSPRRSPLPPSLRSAGNSPSLGVPFANSGPATLKELLNERSRHSPLAPPSPAMSNTSTDCFDSPESLHSSTFHYIAHHQTPDLNEMPTTMPLTPQSLNGDFRPYTSQNSSLSASGNSRNYPASSLTPNDQDKDNLDRRITVERTRGPSMDGHTVFDGSVADPAKLGLGGMSPPQGVESPETDSRPRMISILGPKLKINSPAPWDTIAPKAAPPHIESVQPLSDSSARRMSMSSTRRQASKTSNPSAKENVRPSSGPKPSSSRARSFSVLSSKRSAVANVASEQSEAPEDALRGLGLGVGLGLGPESLPQQSLTGMTSSNSMNLSATISGAGAADLSLAVSSISSSEKSPSTASFNRRSTRLPSGFDLISTPIPIEYTSPSTKLPASGAIPSGSNVVTSTISTGDGSSTSSAGQGYSLISLEEARARENVRVINAAAQRKAMLPVEHVVTRNDTAQRGFMPSNERERQISSGTNSTVASSNGALASNNSLSSIATHSSNPAAPAKPTLKTKKSGFLKRIIQGSDKTSSLPTSSQHTPFVKEEEPKKSFRALPDDYVYEPSQPLPGSTAPPSVSAAASAPVLSAGPLRSAVLSPRSKSTLHQVLNPPTEQRSLAKKGSAPELSLRPISMAFSAGLPTSFLANSPNSVSPTIHAPLDSPGSSTNFTRAPLLAPSPSGPPSPVAQPSFPVTESEQQEAFFVLQDQFFGAKRIWMKKQADMEAQIRALRAELEEMKACHPSEEEGLEGVGKPCSHCGCAVQSKAAVSLSASVLTRPRPVPQNTATGSLFGSGLAMAV